MTTNQQLLNSLLAAQPPAQIDVIRIGDTVNTGSEYGRVVSGCHADDGQLTLLLQRDDGSTIWFTPPVDPARSVR